MSTGELVALSCAGIFILVCVICLVTDRSKPRRRNRRGGYDSSSGYMHTPVHFWDFGGGSSRSDSSDGGSSDGGGDGGGGGGGGD